MGVLAHHSQEEKQSWENGERPGQEASAYCLFASLKMPHDEKNGRDDADVVGAILDPADEPTRQHFFRRKACSDVTAETRHAPHEEHEVVGIEDERPHRKKLLDGVRASENEKPDGRDNAEHTHVIRKTEDLTQNATRRGGDNGQDEGHHSQVAHFVQAPRRTEQLSGKRSVVEGAGQPGQLEGDGTDDAPDRRREEQRQESP